MTRACACARTLLCLSLLLLLSAGRSLATSAAWELEVEHILAAIHDFDVVDGDGDGHEDILATAGPAVGVGPRPCIVLYSLRGKTPEVEWMTAFVEGKMGRVRHARLSESGEKLLLLGRTEGDSSTVELYALLSGLDRRTCQRIPTPDVNGDGYWDGSCIPLTVVDVDGDGVLDIVAALGAGYDCRPRGLFVFSGATGQLLRELRTSATPSNAFTWTDPSTGEVIILFVTLAVGNRCQSGILDDMFFYLVAVNEELEVLWHCRIASFARGGDYECADLDGVGAPEVVLSREMEEGKNGPPYRLEIRDLRSGAVQKYRDCFSEISEICVADLDRDTQQEVIVGHRDGTLEIVDRGLDVHLTSQTGNSIIRDWFGPRIQVCDLDLDGDSELAVVLGSHLLVLLDRQLRPIAQREFDKNIRYLGCLHSGRDGQHLLMGIGEDLALIGRRPGQAAATPLGGLGRRWTLISGILIALGGVGLGAGISHGIERRRGVRIHQQERRRRAMREELLSSLAAFGHSGLARSNLERLAQYAESAPAPGDPRRPQYEDRWLSIASTYVSLTRGLIGDILEFSSQSPGQRSRAATLKRSYAALDRVMTGKSLPAPPLPDSNSAGIISASARKVLGEITSLRRSVLADCRTDVVAVVGRYLAVGSDQFRLSGLEYLQLSCCSCALAEIDAECLLMCLEIVLTNAIDSLETSAVRRITVSVQSEQPYVLVEIADSGPGISSDDWERVFEREVTTKGPGRGFGLYHARQALARYGGSIRVKASSEMEGTRILIRLRASEQVQASADEAQSQSGGRT